MHRERCRCCTHRRPAAPCLRTLRSALAGCSHRRRRSGRQEGRSVRPRIERYRSRCSRPSRQRRSRTRPARPAAPPRGELTIGGPVISSVRLIDIDLSRANTEVPKFKEGGMPQFTGGPSVGVTANNQIEFKWNTDVAWQGRVDVFAKIDDATPIFTQWAVDGGGVKVSSMTQVVTIPVAGLVATNSGLAFQITAVDPGDVTSFISSPQNIPWLPFFTGQQTLTNVGVDSVTQTSAT